MEWLGKIKNFVSGGDIPGKLAEQGISHALTKLQQYREVEEELIRLKNTTRRIKALLIDAEERRNIEDEHVKHWLHELKCVSYDSDNLFDKYQTDLQVHKFNTSQANSSRKRKWSDMSVSFEWNPMQRMSLSSEINKINKRLEDIAKSRKDLRLGGQDGTVREGTRHSDLSFHAGPLYDQARIIGREIEKNEIVGVLISDLGISGIPVVPILGAAGIGKTTLARLVHDDERIDHYFDFKVWVCLTDQCDARNAMKEIYEKMTSRKDDFGSFDALEHNLREYIKTKENNKFLLVIDNVWAEGFHFWETLRVPLLSGGNGSKVLITTRNEKSCRNMSALSRGSLIGLDVNECWQILQSVALPQGTDMNADLGQIGWDIAVGCHGSPMAAKTLGCVLLHVRNKEEWFNVLREMRALQNDENSGVLASLKISYHHLPYHLKQCFAYCAIFPNGYTFERDQLIRYWVAEELVQPDGTRRLEAIGKKYFDDLVWRSFFEKIPISNKGQGERYRMPSLIYDLARHVSEKETRVLHCTANSLDNNDNEANTSEVRYASLLWREGTQLATTERVESFISLRTLKLCDERGECIVPLISIPPTLFHTLTHMRVLDLSNSGLESLPDAVGGLIHLRYLGLSNTEIKTLPESVCGLFNLQTLDLKGCSKLERLPPKINKLINLRHLDLHLNWEEITEKTQLVIPEPIDELKSLQTLSRFNVISSNNGQSCNINELMNLNLRGDLCLLNLENISTVQEAKNANLGQKKYLENLMLRWSSNSTSMNSDRRLLSKQVIESLKPDNSLKSLWIVNYPGTSFPDWVGHTSFSSLETIRISGCNDFSLDNLPRLKNLHIEDVPATDMNMFVELPSLEYLHLSKMPRLERISIPNEFPKLQKIKVSECPKLKEVDLHRDLHNKFDKDN